jgi:hypothetical protein
MQTLLTLTAFCHALAARLWRALEPVPLALPPVALDALTVADLRRMAAGAKLPRRLYTYGRRADLLAALS